MPPNMTRQNDRMLQKPASLLGGKDLKDLTVLQGLAEHERQSGMSARHGIRRFAKHLHFLGVSRMTLEATGHGWLWSSSHAGQLHGHGRLEWRHGLWKSLTKGRKELGFQNVLGGFETTGSLTKAQEWWINVIFFVFFSDTITWSRWVAAPVYRQAIRPTTSTASSMLDISETSNKLQCCEQRQRQNLFYTVLYRHLTSIVHSLNLQKLGERCSRFCCWTEDTGPGVYGSRSGNDAGISWMGKCKSSDHFHLAFDSSTL